VADEPESDRLKALEERLERARKRAEPERAHMEEHYSQAQLAWRMVIELVAGLGIGFGIGFGLDAVLGTRPWLMVIFTLLGFVAGVKTMIRSAQEAQRKQIEAAGKAADDEKG
jgi:ATP synthase protein I